MRQKLSLVCVTVAFIAATVWVLATIGAIVVPPFFGARAESIICVFLLVAAAAEGVLYIFGWLSLRNRKPD